jgi:exopolysaccharide biosynthesis polyprenyl glycosylphosphotransferase
MRANILGGMAIPDYLEQVVLHSDRSQQDRAKSRQAGLFVRSGTTVSIWAGLDFLSAIFAGFVAVHLRLTAPAASAGGWLPRLWTAVPLISVAYLVLFSLYVVMFARVYGLYRSPEGRSGLNEQRLTMQAVLTAGMLLCGTLYVMRAEAVSRLVVLLTLILTMAMMMLRRAVWRKLRERRFQLGYETRNVLIVGDGRVGQALRNHLSALQYMGFRFMGFVALDSSSEAANPQVVGSVENCVALARSLFVDEIYFSSPSDRETVISVVEEARAAGIEVRVIPDLYDGLAWNTPVEFIGQFPTIPLHRRDFPRGAFLLKRMMDVALCVAAMVVCSPLLLLVALLIRWDSPGPALYRSQRIGMKGRVFTCLKFRTMVDAAEGMRPELAHMNERDGVLFKIRKDPRRTRVGAWLRKYSIDELPQMLNVLRGDMSLVGPRPPLASEVLEYDLTQLRRLDVLPGITGLWQVEARQDPSFDSYISLDTAYVENWSLTLDMRILARTVAVVLEGTGT